MKKSYDALIVGGGHNGLVCAAYLAARGWSVRILERRSLVGGAAVTEEFHPGFRNSTASYTVSLLHPKVIRDLRLSEHGLRVVERPYSNFLPLGDADYLKVGGGLAATQSEVARFSKRDAGRLPRYYAMLESVAAVLKDLLLETPPNVGGGIRDLFQALKVGKRFKALDMSVRRDVLDLFAKSAGDLLDQWFESDPIKACFGFDSVVGNFASPYMAGSGYVLLHHVFGEVNGKPGIWGHAIGGMGAITAAMAREAARRGVEITTDAAVASVLLRDAEAGSEATGVVLEDGREIHAKTVVSNLNPKLLFQTLVDPARLPDDFRRRIDAYKCASGTFRMNLALSELPRFACLPTQGNLPAPHHSSGIIMAPSLRYMEQAYFDARSSGWSKQPIVEMLIPSTVDDTLAPPGRHVASLFCQHVMPDLPGGRSWDEAREQVAEVMIDTVDGYAPNFKASVMARQIHTPLDLERKFGMVGGDIFHGALSLDQLFSARPVLGYGDYRPPIRRLYQCGSGTHPGGGVTGIPGHNAAREILRDGRG
ncbi:MAG: NAD(P)/FAD-dependent oxidoreductase [Rhodocyclaceae bacterium]|nr:MAG: NAD(P)/FAD-dependent oxidoreductase [Rhodocyclaceae bacterium]